MAVMIIFGVALLALTVLPQMWVKRVIAQHSQERDDFPGTGGELARHLLDEMKLNAVGVEQTDLGDHYDPDAKVVRLLPQHFGGKSLSAVVIAAHEVGHAMQDATGYPPLRARTQLAKQAHRVQQVAMVLLMIAPLLVIIARSPAILVIELLGVVLLVSMSVLMHVTTLPVEFDASFKRALPILKAGNYVEEQDMASARQILRAAAFTYVAAAAMSLLDIMRWLRFLRF